MEYPSKSIQNTQPSVTKAQPKNGCKCILLLEKCSGLFSAFPICTWKQEFWIASSLYEPIHFIVRCCAITLKIQSRCWNFFKSRWDIKTWLFRYLLGQQIPSWFTGWDEWQGMIIMCSLSRWNLIKMFFSPLFAPLFSAYFTMMDVMNVSTLRIHAQWHILWSNLSQLLRLSWHCIQLRQVIIFHPPSKSPTF